MNTDGILDWQMIEKTTTRKMLELTEKGAILNNLEEGVVGFYSLQNQKPVVLCWKIGDRHIKYWHEADEDFSSRKPISKLREIVFDK